MLNRPISPFLFILIAFATTAMIISVAKAQTTVPQTVIPSPSASPIPSPTPTSSLEERLDILEIQVADLNKKMNTSKVREYVDIIQSAFTVIALIVGGIWSYWLFVQNRQKYPRANIAHRIAHRHIANGKLLLHVNVIISNTGDVLLSLIHLETRIQQVLPLPAGILDSINKGQNPVPEGETEVAWPLIDSQELEVKEGECEIEPGESQEIHHDFIIDAEVETVEVYSYLLNEQKRVREIAWDLTTLYDLNVTEKAFSYATRSGPNVQNATKKTEKAET
jgi:hypothetical protein